LSSSELIFPPCDAVTFIGWIMILISSSESSTNMAGEAIGEAICKNLNSTDTDDVYKPAVETDCF
jgi:hypothetical protein